MKRFQTVLLALFAVFAFGAILVATASAEETLVALWLANGVDSPANLPVEIKGALLLEDTNTAIGKAAVICEGTLDGTIGPNGKDEIKEILNVAKEAVAANPGLALKGTNATGPDCLTSTGCLAGTAASPIEVWPIGLPWTSQLFLMADGTILDLVTKAGGGTFGYWLLCLVTALGVQAEDLCTGEDGEILVTNNAAGDASSPVGSEVTPAFNCTMGGAASGLNVASSEGL